MGLKLLIFFLLFLIPSSAFPQTPSPLQHFLKQRGVNPKTTGVYAVRAETGEPLAAYQETMPLLPASTLKILTAACSLKKLGVAYTFKTNFYSERPVQNGTIENLWVKGEGDPSMVSEKLWIEVQKLKAPGLKKIGGDIYIDPSFFDAQDYPGRQENNERAYNAPTSALSLNFNSLTLMIFPNGLQTVVTLFPESSYFKLDNRLKTGGRKNVAITSSPQEDSEIITVSGSIPATGESAVFFRSIRQPELFFGHALKDFLLQNGISFSGKIKRGSAHGKYLLHAAESKPLHEIIQDMNKFSNNFLAEQIVKHLGAKLKGAPGSTAKGTDVLEQCFREMGGGKNTRFQIEGGSGFSYKNRISSLDLARILTAAYNDPAIAPEFISSLSVSGVDGTMRRRKPPKEIEGFLRAKTGSLNGTNTLAGFVPLQKGGQMAVVILMNNYRGGYWEALRIQDRLIAGLKTPGK